MNADVHALTGAYVLDAVSDLERVEFERHLGDCDACRQEVAELRETATRLGTAAAVESPPWMKTAVMARISQVRQLPPDAGALASRRRASRWALRVSSAAAAVLLVTTTVLGVQLMRTEQSVEDAQAQTELMASILRAGDAQLVTQGDSSSGRMVMLASRAQDRMVLVTDGLPAAPAGSDYQAWTLGEETRSAGLIKPEDGRATLEVSGIDTAQQVGITVEPAGGSDQPTTQTIMQFPLV
ncbi:MAG TPA: anti-sigma factor [Actinophytocola sp.]|nr:anti-sigma factor [Actinophytocola sp.]